MKLGREWELQPS